MKAQRAWRTMAQTLGMLAGGVFLGYVVSMPSSMVDRPLLLAALAVAGAGGWLLGREMR